MLLSPLFRAACSHGDGRPFEILLDPRWVCRWPRPRLVHGDEFHRLSVNISKEAVVDLAGLRQAVVAQDGSNVAKKWYSCLLKCGLRPQEDAVDLLDFLKRFFGIKLLVPLLGQLLWKVGMQLESYLGEQNKKKGTAEGLVVFKTRTFEDSLTGSNKDQKLVQYVLAAGEESSKHRVFSIATDKGSPCNLVLQNSTITYTNNVSVLCTPQVPTIARSKADRREEFTSTTSAAGLVKESPRDLVVVYIIPWP